LNLLRLISVYISEARFLWPATQGIEGRRRVFFTAKGKQTGFFYKNPVCQIRNSGRRRLYVFQEDSAGVIFYVGGAFHISGRV
jgi:hypothetical protein